MSSRKTDWIIGLLVSLLVLIAAHNGFLQIYEQAAYGLGQRLSFTRPPHPQVVVVAIDDASLDVLGAWPWSRDLLARITRKLSEGAPSLMAYTFSFEAPHNERGLQIMGEFRDELGALMTAEVRQSLQRAVNKLDTDHALAMSFRLAENVLLEMPFESAQGEGSATGPLPAWIEQFALPSRAYAEGGRFSNWPVWLQPATKVSIGRLYPPTEKIGAAAAGIAAAALPINAAAGWRLPLLLRYGERWLPSLPLAIAAHSQGVLAKSIEVTAEGVQMGGVRYATDNALQVYPYFPPAADDAKAIPVYSFAAVDSGRIAAEVFKNKIVLLGVTAARFAPRLTTPSGSAMPAVMVTAQQVSSLLQQDLFQISEQGYLLRYAIFAVIALYLILLLPRLSFGTGLSLSVLLLVLLLITELAFMLFRSEWVPLMSAAVLLISGHILLMLKGAVTAQLQIYQTQLAESNRMLGQTLQAQGQLDQAFVKYQQSAVNEETFSLLYSLGLDYERKRQFNKAAEVFKHLRDRRRDYRDSEARIKKNLQLADAILLGKDSNPGSDTLIITDNGIQKPVLGRYEIERELGRGAMGMVYLGRDPRIGRTVAIKTMSFSQEFANENIAEIKQRFFREAEAAGRLRHPNIVTIYDVGEEQELCYIAMDYLAGEDLSGFTTAANRLPIVTVLDIGIQVAEALHYAHQHKVVHRDIKPGNILYDPQNGRVTVTDFGVASLTDTSKTRTGTILGSPAYMAPEQLVGHKVDGRADLFSLGVTLFQLLAGELPFKGDSLSNLMYKITHEKQPDLHQLRSELPKCIVTIINRALQKDAAKRYVDGDKMAAALRRCRQTLDVNP